MDKILKMVKMAIAPAALAVAMAAFSPSMALAAERGGGHGFSGGRSYAAPRGNIGGGRAFSAPARGFYGERDFPGGPGYYRPGFGVGVGVGVGVYPYGYAAPAPVCNPAGYYDANGVFQYYPGCVVTPYGY